MHRHSLLSWYQFHQANAYSVEIDKFVVVINTAIVQPPSASLVSGLTTLDLGAPDPVLASIQHSAYCAALQAAGVKLVVMKPNAQFPDGTFVEDVAICLKDHAIITRPGAESRRGETANVASALSDYYGSFDRIIVPGTVDGGDILEIEGKFFIGLSKRTNTAGAAQLADVLARHGHTSVTVIFDHFLHLKSGVSYLGNGVVLLAEQFADLDEFKNYERIIVPVEEAYAANALEINGAIFMAKGFATTEHLVRARFDNVTILDMSEFEKVDGGLSCLSLRF